MKRHRGESHVKTGRDYSYATTSQEMPQPPELEEAQESSQSLQRECKPADNLISEFQPPEFIRE